MEEPPEFPELDLTPPTPDEWLDLEARRASYKVKLNPKYIGYLDSLTLDKLWAEAQRIERQEGLSSDLKERSLLYKAKLEVVNRLVEHSDEEVKRNIDNLQSLVEQVENPEIRENMIVELRGLEKKADEGETIQKAKATLELEQRKIQMQLDAEERRVKTRMRYFDRFLERESAATILGAIILIMLTIALLVAMYTQDRAREIVYSGFLILLGYFFGQTAGKAAANRNSSE